ncbi:hypothetical protein F5X68DRAFT_50103 [Plectosphaerella plurivora]|uniref:Uncharacterized protein n=1 Tax=Plectosphaerella plurivora TaxID=936078 RepID=A0A9P8V4I8_9PEZI|nr:hypothetical protein F5X68DRAFT_50103 [Plectosphaerella plurivora]
MGLIKTCWGDAQVKRGFNLPEPMWMKQGLAGVLVCLVLKTLGADERVFVRLEKNGPVDSILIKVSVMGGNEDAAAAQRAEARLATVHGRGGGRDGCRSDFSFPVVEDEKERSVGVTECLFMVALILRVPLCRPGTSGLKNMDAILKGRQSRVGG